MGLYNATYYYYKKKRKNNEAIIDELRQENQTLKEKIKNNEAIIDELRQENQTFKERIKANITEGAKDSVKKYMAKDSLIPKMEAQIKGVFMELEDKKSSNEINIDL